MDLLSEGDVAVRVLTARHISDKTFTETNNAINATTLLCQNYSLQPDFVTYFAALQKYAIGLWVSGFIILLSICVLYGISVQSVWRHSRSSASYTAVVLSVYPVVALSAYIATIVPRAMLVCEAIAQQVVVVALYNFFCMLIVEGGGIDKLVSRAGDCHLETRVLPCCCWPCCVIPRPQLQTRNLLRIRYLVLQVPVVQAIIYICKLIIWAEDVNLYIRSFVYFQPFVAASILTGLWGIMMCVRVAEEGGARPRPRLLALQLVLFIVKLQYGAVRALPTMVHMPCVMALHPAVFVNLLQNITTLVEMLLLSVLAWRLYSTPSTKAVGKVHHAVIATVEDNSLDFKPLGMNAKKEKSFHNDNNM